MGGQEMVQAPHAIGWIKQLGRQNAQKRMCNCCDHRRRDPLARDIPDRKSYQVFIDQYEVIGVATN